MKKLIAFGFLLMITFSMVSMAQSRSITIRGTVIAADDTLPIIGAMVRLNAADSAKIGLKGRTVLSDVNGKFTLASREKKNNVTISFIGYTTTTVPVPAPDSRGVVNLGRVVLPVAASIIEDVTVVGNAGMAKILGDTTQYNASSFKTNPDATAEDLLKKLPGVSTDENGNVQSQGEKIAKVMVNGKEFFENDPSAALKNLPVDAVESMQIYDSQSDDAKFSGFDDGERIKTINIVTKKGVMNSTFGKVYGGGGFFNPSTDVTDRSMRYAGGVGVNIWRGDHRFTIIAQANNVNNQGFTLNDIGSGTSRRGGRGRMGGGGTDLNGFTTPARGGLQQTYMAGFNYNGTFSEKFKMSASYFFNSVTADVWNARDQQYLTIPRNYMDTTASNGSQNSHSLSIRTEWNPNLANRITFNPSFSFSNNSGDRTSSSLTYLDGKMSNAARSAYTTSLERLNGSADLWWQHSFGNSGRTLSVGGVFNVRHDDGHRTQMSNYTSLGLNNAMLYDTIRQMGRVIGDGYTITGSATYTEPISKRSRLTANYSITYDRSLSDKKGWNWDKLMQDYALVDTTTTNYLNRNYTTHMVGLGYNYVIAKQLTLVATVNYQNAMLNNSQISPRESLTSNSKYNFDAVLPSFRLSYTPNKGHNLNLDYNATSIFPSVSQLQDVLDVDNPLQVSRGNSSLRQSYSNAITLRYSYANLVKNINFSIMGRGNVTSDYIATHRRFMTQDTVVNGTTIVRGAQYSEPVNLDGYVSARVFANFGVGLKFMKSNLNLMAMYSYTRSPSMQDNKIYISNSNRIGGRLSLTSNISENVDFTLYYSPSLNLTRAGTGRFDRYYGHNLGGNINVIFLKYFFVNVDAYWNNSFGTQESYTQHFAMVNAAVGAKFLKNRAAEIRLSGYDLLNQNRSFYSSTTDTYIQNTTTNILRQYFMASFTYKFDTRKNRTATTTEDGYMQNRPPMGRPMGGGYGGGGFH
ncbi:MAG: outer membrane beta-barrel protein [Mucinivorans sp.]